MQITQLFKTVSKLHLVGLVGIMLLAGFLRLSQLSILLYGFHNDEVMNGYVGRFILENGKDLYGNPWPILYFDNFGDFPNVVPMYVSGLSTYLFGVTEFAVRLPIAIFGILTVLVVYVFQRWLFKEPVVALLSALIMAVLPWHLVLSRATAEGVTASFVLLLGIGIIFASLAHGWKVRYGLGVLLLVTCYLLYPGFRVIVPLVSLSFIWLAGTRSWKIATLITALIFFGLTGYISQTEWGRGRYEQTSVFTHNHTIKNRAEQFNAGLGGEHIAEARIFHNQYILAGTEIARQYLSYFSPTFLLSPTGLPPRYSILEHGQIYFILVALTVIAVGIQCTTPLSSKRVGELFKENRGRYFAALMFILLISPAPAALTLDDVPNIHRTILTGILLVFFWGFASAIIWEKLQQPLWRMILMSGFVAVVAGETIMFWHYYANLSRTSTALVRNEAERSVVSWVGMHQTQYGTIYLPGEQAMALHYLFHQHDFRPELAGQFTHGMKIDQVGSVHFVNEICNELGKLQIEHNPPSVVVIPSNCSYSERDYSLVTTISYSNQAAAYLILEARPITTSTSTLAE